MNLFIFWGAILLAGLAGALALYSNKTYTLPGYAGKGGWVHLIVVALLGWAAVWYLGTAFGAGNVFALIAENFEFSMRYGDAYLLASMWVMIVGLLAALGVGIKQLMANGRAQV